jgi:hypothetical protein
MTSIPILDKLQMWAKVWFQGIERTQNEITYNNWDYYNANYTVVITVDDKRVIMIAEYGPMRLFSKIPNFRKKLLERQYEKHGAMYTEENEIVYTKADFLMTCSDDKADRLAFWDKCAAIQELMSELTNDIYTGLDAPT